MTVKRALKLGYIAVLLLAHVALYAAMPSETYTDYLPVMYKEPTYRHGLAMADWTHPEDVSALNAKWFYGWGEYCGNRANCVNMVRQMQLPRSCYPVLLVGNEPNWLEPSGAPVSPEDAAERVWAIEKMCPQTRLVVGGVIPFDTTAYGGCCSGRDWLLRFLAAYPNFRQALAVHCYDAYDSGYCIDQLAEFRLLYAGEMWVTEFNCVRECSMDYFRQLLDAVAQYDGYAIYTNRQPDEPWALDGASLVNADGTLTSLGAVYVEFP